VIRELANVDRTYWRLYAAREFLDVTVSQYELAREQLERARRRVRAGDAAEVEVIRAESGVAERLEVIINAVNDVRNAQRELKRVINLPGLDVGSVTMLIPASSPDPVPYALDPGVLADAGVQNRMEMLEIELRLAQDLSTIDFAKNQALPSFVLDFQYTVNGLGPTYNRSVSVVSDMEFRDWFVRGTFEVPLGNEAAESRVHQAILRRLQRLSSKAARELAIRQEVHSSVDGLQASWQRILAARQAVILAERTLQAEQNQFRVGARTSTDVLDAATRLADAQASEIRALTDYQIAQVELAFATGTLLGASRIEWTPLDPRGPEDFTGEQRIRNVSGRAAPGSPATDAGADPNG
jgi:outer membrane protein TolC